MWREPSSPRPARALVRNARVRGAARLAWSAAGAARRPVRWRGCLASWNTPAANGGGGTAAARRGLAADHTGCGCAAAAPAACRAAAPCIRLPAAARCGWTGTAAWAHSAVRCPAAFTCGCSIGSSSSSIIGMGICCGGRCGLAELAVVRSRRRPARGSTGRIMMRSYSEAPRADRRAARRCSRSPSAAACRAPRAPARRPAGA